MSTKEYVPQLRISSTDPVCAASNIGDTVIGVLFEKKGSEIKTAIKTRVSLIDNKVTNYQTVVTNIETFLDKKRVVLKELDLFYQSRVDDKTAALQPVKRQIRELQKKGGDIAFDHDRETLKKLGEKAVTFEDGFDAFKPQFDDLDTFLKREQDRVLDGLQGIAGATGSCGSPGIQGYTGTQGIERLKNEFYSPQLNTDNLDKPERVRGIGYGDSVDDDDDGETAEDRALAKLRTLRNQVEKYVGKIELLKQAIRRLEEEKRRLQLIYRNINDDRIYKLDLNKLSAFGFEDIEVL